MIRVNKLVVVVSCVGFFQVGCVCQQAYRMHFKPDQVSAQRYEDAKSQWADLYGAKIVWETGDDVAQYGMTYHRDFVFYKVKESISVMGYTRIKGRAGLTHNGVITKIRARGCLYTGTSDGYEYGWSGNDDYAVRSRQKVIDINAMNTNCGEFVGMPVWSHVVKIIPADMAAHAEENGSVVLSMKSSKMPSFD